MYTVTVIRDFISRHFLIGGDWGAENDLHSHHYKIELMLEGNRLDKNGYLVDIVDIEKALSGIMGYFQDRTLNELPEFRDLNPSIENFARILNAMSAERIENGNLSAITVKLWENDNAWSSFRKEL